MGLGTKTKGMRTGNGDGEKDREGKYLSYVFVKLFEERGPVPVEVSIKNNLLVVADPDGILSH